MAADYGEQMSIVEKAVGKHKERTGQDAEPGKSQAPGVEPVTEGIVANRNSAVPGAKVADEGAKAGADGERNPEILKLNFEALRQASIVPSQDRAPNLANEFRRIKRPLLSNAFAKGDKAVPNGNVVMLCSALSGDGKTFTAMNLAMSVALERERTVLLVDADVAKPHISRTLGLQRRRGLMDLLLDSSLDLGDVLVETDMPGLRVLPAGSQHEYATELLASERMEELISELQGRYPNRFIIFDSPPLLQTSEAQVLASHMGQVVLVVHAGSTPAAAVDNALDLIADGKAVSLVLNKCRIAGSGDYYGGYYGQGG